MGFLSPVAPFAGLNSEVDMGTETRNDNRPAIAVTTGIVDERDLGRQVQAADDMGGVVRLAHALSPISKSSVA